MSKSIKSDLLVREIIKVLESCSDDISEIVEQEANQVGKEAVNELKQNSPRGIRKRYAKGWSLKKDKKGKSRYSVKVHNKTDYQLTHLIENSHATRNGGRTKENPHIRPVEEKYSKEFEERLKRRIGGLKCH